MSASISHIPYYSSKTLLFNYRETANVYAGKFNWNYNTRNFFTPRIDVDSPFLYVIKSFSFGADINELDYQSAMDLSLNVVPEFSLYLKSEGSGAILRMPLQLPTYYSDQEFTQSLIPRKTQSGASSNTADAIQNSFTAKEANQFLGSFKGTLALTPNLIGKKSITLILTLSVIEIHDQKFIEAFKSMFGGAPEKRLGLQAQTLRRN